MNRDIDFGTMPANYVVCWQKECPLAAGCLRRMGSIHIPASQNYVTSINPLAATSYGRDCPHYRPARWITVAYGLRHIYDNVPYRVGRALYQTIHARLRNTMYYHYYHERRAMSPEVQDIIRAAFQRYGIEEPVQFSRYEEVIDW